MKKKSLNIMRRIRKKDTNMINLKLNLIKTNR